MSARRAAPAPFLVAATVVAFGIVGIADALAAAAGRVGARDTLAAVGWVASLYALAGALVGLALVAARRAVAPLRAVLERASPADAIAWPVAAGATSMACFVALYHAAHHFFTAYRNLTMAAFALAVAVAVITAAAVVLALVLRVLLSRVFARVTDRRLGLAGLALTWLLPVAWGIARGTTGGEGGALGFLGLLKKDELDLAPIALVAAAVVLALVSAARAARRPRVLVALAGLLCGGALATVFSYGARPAAADAIDRRAPLARLVVAAGRRALDRDGDGYAALLGGGDCDDRRRGVYPGADERPGNGIDEDCSGSDLARRPRRASATATPVTAPPTARTLPADLSIVLVTVDTLRWDLGYMGYARPVSPNIDRLAKRGVVYERAYALSSYTGKALPPMLIGRFPTETHRDQQHFTRYGEQNTFLAEVLKRAGMQTGAVLPHWYFRKSSGMAQGFDRWDLEAIPRGAGHIDVQQSSPAVTERALAMLGDPAFTQQGRFFLWVHYLDPHREYLPHDDAPPFGTSRRDLYDGEVRFTDGHVGRLLDAIAAHPAASRIAVVLTSDHGEAFGEHDVFFHGRDLFDEMIRVPLIIAVPGVAPRRIQRRVSHVDFAPTMYDLAGVTPPAGLSGQSLLPEIQGAALPDRPVYAELPIGPYNDERRALIQDGWKLVQISAGNRALLYHLDEDPGEARDLAATHPADLARMKEALAELRASFDLVEPTGPLVPGGGRTTER